MKTCESCGKEIEDAAATCRFCGAAAANPQASVLAQVADAEIKLRTLVLSIPLYARNFVDILKSPIDYFRRLDYSAHDGLKRAVAFMVQGVALGYLIFILGLALPQSIAGWLATHPPLLAGSSQQLADYARRIEDLKGALTPALAREWFRQSELMLAVRILPEDRFQRMLQRARELSERNPDYLERAIKGPLASSDRFGGRGHILSFFLALDPRVSAFLPQIQQMADIGPKYELKAHVDFLLRATILWLLTCYVILRFMPSRQDPQGLAPFVIGAYLVGFVTPLIESVRTLVHTYLAIVLPPYIAKASGLLMGQGPSDLGQVTGGLYPFENLLLFAVRLAVPVAAAAVALSAFVNGTQSAYGIARNKAWAAASVGLGTGLGATELVSGFMVMILARSGLL